jgi:alpha-1,2-glucosyltransferase
MSCTFRQTNVIWVLYAYASSQLMYLRFRRAPPGAKPFTQLHDPPALTATLGTYMSLFYHASSSFLPGDVAQSVLSAPKILGDILPAFVPYTVVLTLFGAFVVWNGGIVLGTKPRFFHEM